MDQGLNTTPGVLKIDLAALAANWRALARRGGRASCAAVIKANAYGVGIENAAPALFAAGCRVFFVAHIAEGARARAALGATPKIYVLNGLEAGAGPAEYSEHGLAPVIGSLEEAARWPASSPCALHVDTGMNRLGFASLADLAAMSDRRGADLLMSHFVSAEAPDDPHNAAQIRDFDAARAMFPHLPASLANSSGIFLPQAPHYDLIRPGYALYGGNPTPGQANPMQPVATVEVAIQQTRWIEVGESCGYNAQWTAKRRTRLATLLVGYADGLPPAAGATDERDGAEVAIAGRRCQLVGRLSMDLSIADVTDLPEGAARPGVQAQIFGAQVPLDDFARASGTIGYQLLTSLGARYARVINQGESSA